MKPKISMVSLSVSDLGRSLAFYRDGLGFPTHNYADGDDYIMFKLESSWLSLMAKDRSGAAPDTHAVSLQHNVPSEAAVREVFELGVAAGATALKAPQPAPWGGYEADFADPDGHVWGIAYNPFTDLT
ncbi:MAG TPA: VOC family protein [Caulobacteraceae bacterium]|nr:VOC family protein [Caulobacteraceae bacterium]